MTDGIRWTVHDRSGNPVYLTEERWHHITQPHNHPDMLHFEAELMQTIQLSRPKQDAVNPQKYSYVRAFDNLGDDNTHIVVVVLFRFRERSGRRPEPNNYIVTAYQKEIG